MIKPLISVIMPAYNVEKYIQESILSVLNQTYQNWELLIIDDGSTDRTKKQIEIASKDDRITYHFQENCRQGKARNAAISRCKGEYIAFLDADDLWEVNKLQIQINLLLADSTIDLTFCQGYFLENGVKSNYDVRVRHWNSDDSLDEFIQGNKIPILSVLSKRQVLIKAGLFSDNPLVQNAEDYHLWLKILIQGAVLQSTSDRLFSYRIHEGQATYQNRCVAHPIFYTYQDLLVAAKDPSIKKRFLNKIIWYVFQPEFQVQAIRTIQMYFEANKKRLPWLLVSIVKQISIRLAAKVTFQLVIRNA